MLLEMIQNEEEKFNIAKREERISGMRPFITPQDILIP